MRLYPYVVAAVVVSASGCVEEGPVVEGGLEVEGVPVQEVDGSDYMVEGVEVQSVDGSDYMVEGVGVQSADGSDYMVNDT